MSGLTDVLASDEARKRLPAMLRAFRRQGKDAPHFVVGRHRRPEAVVLPYATYIELVPDAAAAAASIDPMQLVRDRREEILRLADKRGARNVRVFGSVARGDALAGSDIDFLVAMDEGHGLLDLVGLWQDLEELLGVKVDVVTEGGLKPGIRERVHAEAVSL
jgi:predicted nucleotidyltransferase